MPLLFIAVASFLWRFYYGSGTGDGRALRGTHKRDVSTQEDWRELARLLRLGK